MPSRIALKCPFAQDGTLADIADSDGNSINYTTGFPSIYSIPASGGGKYLGRGDINALGNIATNDLFYHKCGGLNTYDAEFAAKVGGYPKGAILDYVTGEGVVRRIRSLVDNNTTNPIVNGIDNTSWIVCDTSTTWDGDLIASFTMTNQSSYAGYFKLSNSLESFKVSIPDATAEEPTNLYWEWANPGDKFSLMSGIAVLIKEVDSLPGTVSLPSYTFGGTSITWTTNGWKALAGNVIVYGVNVPSSATYELYSSQFPDLFTGPIVSGKYYMVAIYTSGYEYIPSGVVEPSVPTGHERWLTISRPLVIDGDIRIYRGSI